MAEEGLPPREAQPEGEEFAVPEVQEEPGYILVSLPATPEKAAPGEAARGESAAESAAAEPEQAARGESAPAQQARSASEPVVYAAAIPAAPILAEPVKAMQLPKAESAAPQKIPSAGALVYLVVYMHECECVCDADIGVLSTGCMYTRRTLCIVGSTEQVHVLCVC